MSCPKFPYIQPSQNYIQRIYLFPVFILLLTSCKKSTNSQTGSSSGGMLVSARTYSGGQLVSTDSFAYNAKGNLAMQRQEGFTNGTSIGFFILTFNYSGTSSDPASYTLSDGSTSFTYTMSYNAQGRLAKDTMIPDLAAIASTFYYPGNNIVYMSADNGSADTLFIQKGNIVKTVQGSIPPDPSSNTVGIFAYTQTYPNPYYYTGQTENVRLLITKIDAWSMFVDDCISQNICTSVSENGAVPRQIVSTVDGSGKVVTATTLNLAAHFLYK